MSELDEQIGVAAKNATIRYPDHVVAHWNSYLGTVETLTGWTRDQVLMMELAQSVNRLVEALIANGERQKPILEYMEKEIKSDESWNG